MVYFVTFFLELLFIDNLEMSRIKKKSVGQVGWGLRFLLPPLAMPIAEESLV